jgi:nucleotide-binding universal stress UspA family protein
MYRRILVAIDGSPHAERALNHACGLAAGLSATLCVLHVVDTGWLGLELELAIDTSKIGMARREAGETLLRYAQAAAQAAGVKAETLLLETTTPADSIAGVIVQAAVDGSADVVVLGTHGRKGLERMLLGSVAEGMARLSPVPVLLVPFHK